MKEMDEFLCRLLWGQLKSMGLFTEKNPLIADLKTKSGLRDLYDRWLEESIAVLARKNYLKHDGNSCTVIDTMPVDIDAVWKEWDREKGAWLEDASLKAQVVLVEATLRVLPEILTGKVPATDIIFPDSSMELVEGIYKNIPVADYFNEVLANTVVAYVQERLKLDSSARIRILEIGAGTGGTSVMVFKKLRPYQEHIQEYCYTDISKAFLIHAEKEYGPKNPYLTYKIFNVEAPVARQGISAGGYDIVIAANVLHATKNIRQTLRNAKVVLQKNGLILLNEITGNSLFFHLTFGLLEGWWLYEDTELRIPGCPGLNPQTWQEVLESEGFRSVLFPAQESHDLGQQIVIAESDGIVRQERQQNRSAMSVKKTIKTSHSSINHKTPQLPIAQDKHLTLQKTNPIQRGVDVTDQMVEEYVKETIINKLAETLKVDINAINVDESFADYGLDSITGVLLVRLVNQSLTIDLETTRLFDYSSVNQLMKYILSKYRDVIVAALGQNIKLIDNDHDLLSAQKEDYLVCSNPKLFQRKRMLPESYIIKKEESAKDSIQKVPIAIIGMSGRFARSKTVNELWDHLSNGTDLIEEVTRWDLSEYFSKQTINYCKYGSFLDDFDQFDPRFFNISGLEATYMDPQQRLFLEESWKALEDAGYVGTGVQGRLCGVYVGCSGGDYEQLFKNNVPAQAFWGNASSVIPARIAYYLNLQGPAVAVDTACSSSLVAIHLACQGLWARETELALAGGVFIQNTPGFYLSASRAGMLSPTGRCYTFDERADGFVPGEGVGVVVLKGLKEAIADGDHIYGVIRGSGINQDGTTNGITAPSANSQERLERYVYDTFNINPEQIQMVEAHGTGTKLGDPIEYEALTRAFRNYTEKKEYCAIGSIKTNIGHAATAAGVAGLIKILLSLQHKKIPPSLHFQSGNSNIQFKDSPFYVNTSLKDWEIEPNSKRCAVISSFGFSGTNAHMVIEEAPKVERQHSEKPGCLIVLSACNSKQLRQQVEQLVGYCEREPQVDCGNMSYTLLLGRKHFNYRLASVVRSQNELVKLFKKWLEKGRMLQINVSELHETEHREQPSLKRYGNQCIQNCQNTNNASDYLEHLSTIAEMYVQGYALEFEKLFSNEHYSRISLPTYPFARERYWVPKVESKSIGSTATTSALVTAIHPLLHRNASNFSEQRFSSTFTGREFFLTEHVVQGQRVLSEMAYLEMARAAVNYLAAGTLEDGQTGIRLKNVVWARPIAVGEHPVQVHIRLYPEDSGEITYEIYSEPEEVDAEPVVHSQGRAVLSLIGEVPTLDVLALQAQYSQVTLSSTQYYGDFRTVGLEYGPGQQGIGKVYVGSGQVLAKLSLPSFISVTGNQFVLHPSMMDAALQASVALLKGSGDLKRVLPFALQELEILGNCTSTMWVFIRYSDGSKAGDKLHKLDVDLCDGQGNVCVRMKGFSLRLLEGEADSAGVPSSFGMLMLEPNWKEQNITPKASAPDYAQRLVMLCEMGEVSQESIEMNGMRCITLKSQQNGIEERFQAYAARAFEEIQNILKEKTKGKVLIQIVVPIQDEQQLFSGLSGLLKTAQLENPKLTGQLIEVELGGNSEGIVEKLKDNSLSPMDNHIRYQDYKRYVTGWSEVQAFQEKIRVPWKDQGVYLITGGAGGLGLLFAKEIAHKTKNATLILTGRSPMDEGKQAKLKELEASGAQIEYKQVDVTQKQAVADLFQGIREKFGSVNGIIHSAGIIRDNFILKKTREELQEVLAPKVTGLVNLDQASKELNLDFFIFFSSIAGSLGNLGQADYSTANAFMDAYAGYRNALVASKQRRGQTLSINWPLWKEGGMHVDEETEKMMMQNIGMTAMQTSTGIHALYQALASGQDRVLVMEGNLARMKQKLLLLTAPMTSQTAINFTTGIDPISLLNKVQAALMQTVSKLIKVKIEDIDANTELIEYGFDPIKLIEFANMLNKEYGFELTPAIFVRHLTLHSIAEYLVVEYKDIVTKQFQTKAAKTSSRAHIPKVDTGLLREKTLYQLKILFGKITKFRVDRIDAGEPLESYGIDSIMITQLNQKLAGIFGELSKTIFFEYKTLEALAEYFIADYAQECMQWTGLVDQVRIIPEVPSAELRFDSAVPVLTSLKAEKKLPRSMAIMAPSKLQEPIAIIGISGLYPQAKNLKEYWENLQEGKDCISEIPEERWSLEGFFHPDRQEAVTQGKSYSKWGGFIEGFADFDTLFFNISPREALNMDPQERLFIESCWEVFEDAGYTKEQLTTKYNGRIGVFAGITKTGFDLYGPDLWKQGEKVFPHTSFSSVANRISYLLNLQGPSMPVDTMCSSSLTAIHEACEHLHHGECEMAIAGGVNLYLHPSSYVGLCAQQMLSAERQCKSFGLGGNGFVPGEGVGVVLLKRLSQAIADEDHIYAVIRGTSINHGGKTNGYTVPNPTAQGKLIRTVLDKAGVNARAISYIEAHGTGTELGDPIEITGLSQAFRKDTQDTGYCAIGSVKSNIGHLEAAAGIAGVTKIVLQMKYQKIVPSLHAKELNPNINFAKTPFVVQQELAEWKRPVVEINGETREYPRIAGISSFGAGGSNAHVVLEEYIPNVQQRSTIMITTQNPAVIVLSAKNKEQLHKQVQQLLAAIQEQQFTDENLADMAYTLQVGREAMEERLAVIVVSIKELEDKLKGFIESQDGIENLYLGQVKSNKETLAVFTADEDMAKTVDAWIIKRKYTKLLDLWVKGLILDWNKLYGDTKPRRISLPTYPFARERYWIPKVDTKFSSTTGPAISGIIHPLLHQNTSDFSEQRFSLTLTGQEFFLADHVVKGERVLPGVAYLEMARAAVEQALGTLKDGQNRIRLKNVVWARPITVGEQPVQVHIGLYPEDSGEIVYEIYSESEEVDAEAVVHSQGIAMLSSLTKVPTLDIRAIKDQCSQVNYSSSQCYEVFKKMGIEYGPGHRGIEKVYVGQGQVLAKLSLPSSVSDTGDQFVLHPSLMDAALQASVGLMMVSGDTNSIVPLKPSLPFALQTLEIFGNCTAAMWALIQYSEGSKTRDKLQKIDIDMYDEQGNILVRMKGFSSRVLEGELGSVGLPSTLSTLILHPYWKEQTIAQGATAPDYDQHVVILCELGEVSQESIEVQMNGVRCITLQSEQNGIEERFQNYAIQAFEEIQSILKEKNKGKVLIQMVVPIQDKQQLFSGLSGLFKTARLENLKLIGQLIEVELGEEAEGIVEKLKDNSRSPIDNHVRYQDDKRYVRGWSEVGASQETVRIPWKNQGVYLITGGTGGLGLIFAKEIAHKVRDATLILTGRSALNEDKRIQLKELEALGAQVQYKQVDVTDRNSVVELLQSICRNFGTIHGIVHSAGVIRDNFIIKKTQDELKEVLAPKVAGLVNLDQASKDLSLDFFILFSSLAGSLGNPGQADYATANAFMDTYAGYRNALVALRKRQGQTLSIGWPLYNGPKNLDTKTGGLKL